MKNRTLLLPLLWLSPLLANTANGFARTLEPTTTARRSSFHRPFSKSSHTISSFSTTNPMTVQSSVPQDLFSPAPQPASSMPVLRQFLQTPATSLSKLWQQHGRGSTAAYLSNALLGVMVVYLFRMAKSSRGYAFSPLSAHCLVLSQVAMVYDNLVNAGGKFLGPGTVLRQLSKARVVAHVMSIPLFMICVAEQSGVAGLYRWQKALLGVALFEGWQWWNADMNQFQPVDLRASQEHHRTYLAGTLAYSAATDRHKTTRLLLPCILLCLSEIVLGSWRFWMQRSHGGAILALTGLVSFLSCSFHKRPHIQLYGETFHSAMLSLALLV